MGGREAREGERAAGGEKSLGNTEERKGRGAKVSSGEAGPGCKGCRREAQVNSPTGAENTDGETSTRGRMFVFKNYTLYILTRITSSFTCFLY